MSKSDPTLTVARLVGQTHEEEMDCDAFAARLAAYVEGRIVDAHVLALIERHRVSCPECEEELLLLRRALEGDG